MPASGNLTIREWRERLLAKLPMGGTAPLEVAADIELARSWKPGTVGKPPPRKTGGSKFGQ